MLLDKEMEALVKCTELIKDLDNEAKLRVMKYLVERFGIGFGNNPVYDNSNQNQEEPVKHIEHTSEETSYEEVAGSSLKDYPSIRDVVIKDYPKTESEWVLIYGFYSSEFGEDSFTRDDIYGLYEKSNRKTTQRRKNLSLNINSGVKKDWYKSLNENEYIMLDEGIKYSKQILKGNSIGSTRKREKKKSNTKSD